MTAREREAVLALIRRGRTRGFWERQRAEDDAVAALLELDPTDEEARDLELVADAVAERIDADRARRRRRRRRTRQVSW